MDSGNSKCSRTLKIPHIEDITDLVHERLNQSSQQFLKGMEYGGLRPSDSPLSNEITILRFSKKFVMSTFNHYSRTSYPLLHLRQYQDKMAVYTHDNLFLYRAFPFSLKGVTYHWFYSLPRISLRNFHDVTDAFYTSLLLKENFRGVATTSSRSR